MRSEDAALKELIEGLERATQGKAASPSSISVFGPCRASKHENCAIASADGFISCECQCHAIVTAGALGLDKANAAHGREWKQ